MSTSTNRTLDADCDELSQIEPIISALKCEQTGHIMEAILLYEESIFKLKEMAEADPSRRQLCCKYLSMYEGRAKQLRDQVKSHLHACRMVDHISIDRGARGRSYQRLLGPYLDNSVREAHLNEPNLKEPEHFRNLINFFEVLVKNCRYLKYIRVTTRPDVVSPKQLQILQQVKTDLAGGNIQMNYQMDEHLHDRKIVLSSGVLIKIGRGLHYFESDREGSVFNMGLCDYDFRKCLATEVDIWRCQPFAKRPKDAQEGEERAERLGYSSD